VLKFRKNKSILMSLFGVVLSVLAYSKYFIELPRVFKTGFPSFSYILLFFLNLAGLTILGYAVLNWTIFRSKWNIEKA